MKFIIHISLISILLLSSCGTEDAASRDIVSRDKMEDVLWDMFRTGEFLQTFVLNRDTSIDKVVVSKAWYDKVYALHEMTKETFDKSYAYYRQRPAIMKDILDSLAKRTPVMVEEIEPIPTDSLQITDSTIKIISPATVDSARAIQAPIELDSNRRRLREKLRPVQSR